MLRCLVDVKQQLVNMRFIHSKIVLSIIFSSWVSLQALPSGMETVAGQASISESGADRLSVTAGPKSVLSWDSFSIGSNEAVHFDLPSEASAVLNRVRGDFPSELFGSLLSNGKVYLINPNGVIIGADARINTGEFIASALDVLNDSFLNEDGLRFAGDSTQGVVNLGTIECAGGRIALIARKVENHGLLKTREGRVALAAGSEVLIKPEGRNWIYIKPELSGDQTPLVQAGEIEALTVDLRSGVDPYQTAIRSAGKITTFAKREEGGSVYLIAEQGEVVSSSQVVTNDVQILGDRIHLEAGGSIDVSAEQGGGRVLIGGDFRGQNPDIAHAKKVLIDPGVSIQADAIGLGDGGRVIVWSDQSTEFFGSISAQGGQEGGNGGLIEVSGNYLAFSGKASTIAPNGLMGDLFLDPTEVRITNALGSTMGPFFYSDTTTPPVAAPAMGTTHEYYSGSPVTTTPVNLDDAVLSAALAINNVTIANNPLGGGSGRVIFSTNAAVSWAVDTTLTVLSSSTLQVVSTASISNTFAMVSDTPAINFWGGIGPQEAGPISGINIAGTVQTTIKDIYMSGLGGNAGSGNTGITIQSGTVHSSGGNITLEGIASVAVASTSGNIGVNVNANSTISTTGGGVSQGDLTITGIGFGSTSTNYGVYILGAGTTLVCANTALDSPGILHIEGTGGGLIGQLATSDNIGVFIQNMTANSIQNLDGNIEIVGYGGNANNGAPNIGNNGVRVDNSTINFASDGLGNLYVTGEAGTGNANEGVVVKNSSLLTVVQGNLNVVGRGSGTGTGTTTSKSGVLISKSTLSSTGAGRNSASILVDGTGGDGGGTGSNLAFGVSVQDGTITSADKDIFILGRGGQNMGGSNNSGVVIQNTAADDGASTVSATGVGSIEISGFGGKAAATTFGVSINNATTIAARPAGGVYSTVSTNSGYISIFGEVPTNADGTTSALVAGVSLFKQGKVTTTTGDIYIEGIGRGGSGSGGVSIGVAVSDSLISCTNAGGGLISILGRGSPSAINSSQGVYFFTDPTMNGQQNTLLSTAGHDVVINGYGGQVTASSAPACGIEFSPTISGMTVFPWVVTATGTGSISLYGQGGTGVDTCQGILLAGNSGTGSLSNLNSSSGNIRLVGTGGPATAGACDGIQLSVAQITSATGNINLVGQATGSTVNNRGVNLQSSQVSSTSTGKGTLAISGIGSTSGTNGNHGVLISGQLDAMTPAVTSVQKDIVITGTANGSGTGNLGVDVLNGATITSTGTGSTTATITVNGQGSFAGTSGNNGVSISSLGLGVIPGFYTVDGDIFVRGVGGGTTTSNVGINLSTSALIQSTGTGAGAGRITLDGQGSLIGTNSNTGIFITTPSDSTVEVSAVDGTVILRGAGGGTGTGNVGIFLTEGGSVVSTGSSSSTGAIFLQGIGGIGTTTNYGIGIQSSSSASTVSGVRATLDFYGVGQGSGANNHGIFIADNAQVNLNTSGSSNVIRLNGRGSASGASQCEGVHVERNTVTPQIGTTDHDIQIRGECATPSTIAIELNGLSLLGTGTSGLELTSRRVGASGGNILVTNSSSLEMTGSGNILVDTVGDFEIDGGGSSLTFLRSSGTGALTGYIGGNLTLAGGGLAGNAAFVGTSSGDTVFSVVGNVALTSGGSANALAQVGLFTGATSNIRFNRIDGNLTITGNDVAAIGHGNPGAALSSSGDITIEHVSGNVSINGATAGPGTHPIAQIGHINGTSNGGTISGNIFLNAVGSVTLTGGSLSGSSATIGHGGQAGTATYGVSAVTVFAGTTLTMTSNTGLAKVLDLSTTMGSGGITLIIDNTNPLNPSTGGSGFTMNSTAVIQNNQAQSGGEVRIYTVTPIQNGITPGQNINGGVMPVSVIGNDTQYEKYNEYYGSGFYGNTMGVAEFNVYYKVPNTPPTICQTCPPCPSGGGGPCVTVISPIAPSIYLFQVATSQLFDHQPLVNGFQSYYYTNWYTIYFHGMAMDAKPMARNKLNQCLHNQGLDECADTSNEFKRFYPFIFESNLY